MTEERNISRPAMEQHAGIVRIIVMLQSQPTIHDYDTKATAQSLNLIA